MSKIYVAQRNAPTYPTLDKVDDRLSTRRVPVNVDNDKFVSTPLPVNFKPDHVQVESDVVLGKRELTVTKPTPYADTIKVTDTDGNRVYPTSEIAAGLGITDSTHVGRLENKLKKMTYSGTDEKVFTEDIDYTELPVSTSIMIRKIQKSINILDNPISAVVAELQEECVRNSETIHSPIVANESNGTSSDDTIAGNSETNRSPIVANESNSVLEPIQGTIGNVYNKPITVWSTQATMRIATGTNTLQGDAFSAKVHDNYLEHCGRNMDIIEDIVETNNQQNTTSKPVESGMSRVSDVVNGLEIPATRGECNRIGRVAKTMSEREDRTIGKATSVFSNTTVNTYEEELLQAAKNAVLGK